MTRKNDERSDVQWGAGLAVARDARERAGHGGRQRSRRRAGRRGAATMLTKLWVVALLAAQNAQPAFADEEDLAEADGEDFGGDDYDGDYGDVGDYGGGGYGGGYGDDDDGGGGDPTPAWETVESFDGIAEFVNQDETEPAVVGFFDADRDADQQKVYEEVAEGSRYDFRFALVTDEAARTAAKLQKGPAVLVYAPPRFVKEGVDKKRARYPSAKLDAEALKKFHPYSGAVKNMPPKERLTAAQHLAKYGADMAFYVNTEEGANIICKPLPYCRLRGDTRQKVLEYLVCVSDKSGERYALRAQPQRFFRVDEIDDPPPPKPVRLVAGVYRDVPLSRGILKRSTAAAVDTLIKHSSLIPAVCKTMNLDYKAVVSRSAATNRATPRAWLEHLYCRPSDGLDDRAVKKELIARQKAGKAANLTRELLRRSRASVEFRHAQVTLGGCAARHLEGPAGGATDGVQVFRCPATWSDAQKAGATRLLQNSQMAHHSDTENDLSRGLAMTHSRVITVDEANAKEPCDREQLIHGGRLPLRQFRSGH